AGAARTLRRIAPDAARFRMDVLAGLSRAHKTLPCKYLYDERGSSLFERICELDEYYPTRTELAILAANAGEMADRLGARCLLAGRVRQRERAQDPAPAGPPARARRLRPDRHLERSARRLGARDRRCLPGARGAARVRRLHRAARAAVARAARGAPGSLLPGL